MAAVESAPWARERTEDEFRQFLADLPGVRLVDGAYVSDQALARGRTAPVAVPAADSGGRGTTSTGSPAKAGLPPALATVTSEAGLTLVSGPVAVGPSGPNRIRYWIFLDPRPVIGGRYLVTLVGTAVSITPDLIARVMRLAEDSHAERAILVGQRSIAAAAEAFARGKPVLLVPAPEEARPRREAQGE